MDDVQTPLRQWRLREKLSLDEVCDQLAGQGLKRPSVAKISRIECGQNVPLDMLPAYEAITGLPAKEIRPDVAKLFLKNDEVAA